MTHSASYSDDWKYTDWKKLQKVLFRLQRRIFKAVREDDTALARRLQKLVLSSYAARMLAIRQVTQLNQGQKTAGIDGKKALTFKERFQLEGVLKLNARNWKHQGLREIPIPKKDGTKRILKIPTIADRAWQCLVKYALEPAHEATFHCRSYGFRPGRSTHNAQKVLFAHLNSSAKGIEKRVIELDIEKCFDRISHKTILNKVIAPKYVVNGLQRCLKAGVNPKFPNQGTPQGGVCLPLLANIALNGIEKIGEYKMGGKLISKCIRYADDMIFILKPEDDQNKLLASIEEFLATRGMNISEKKTKVTATTDGFDFLGWHFIVQRNNGKFRSTPSVENFKTFRKKVKNIVNKSNYRTSEIISKLAPIVRGWRNYHKYCRMEGSKWSLWKLSDSIRKKLLKQKSIDKQEAKRMIKIAFPQIGYSENKFVNVKGDKTPFDGDMNYWAKRKNNLYDGATARRLKAQNYSCGFCNLKFANDERIELHHIDSNHDNWKSKNLIVAHRSCHQYTHMSKVEKT